MMQIKNKLEFHKAVIIDLLNEYKSERTDIQLVIDKENHHYQLLRTAIDAQKRYFSSLLMHFSLREDGIICLFEYRTEEEVADILIEKGDFKFEKRFKKTLF